MKGNWPSPRDLSALGVGLAALVVLMAGCPASTTKTQAHGTPTAGTPGTAGTDGSGGISAGDAGSGGAHGGGGGHNPGGGGQADGGVLPAAGNDAGTRRVSSSDAGSDAAASDNNADGDPSDAAVKPVTCAAGDAPSTCGNGLLDPGESCDGSDLRGLSCATLEPFFTAGTLRCNTNCAMDTSDCWRGTCGNGVVDPGEDCDYRAFTPPLCSDLIPGSDQLALVNCSPSTCRYDLSICMGAPTPVCGNGKRDGDEACDSDDRLSRSCTEAFVDYVGGELHCDQTTCKLDTSQCQRCDGSSCGDGIINGGEQCDGDNLGSSTCADNGRLYGTVHCNGLCNIDYSDCSGGCTIYKGKIVSCN